MERLLQEEQVRTEVVELVRWALIDEHVLELKDHVQLTPGRIRVEPRLFGRHAGHLADRDEVAVAAGEDLAGHLSEVVMHARSVGEPVERRCVGQPVGLGDEIDDIHPKAVDTAVEPPDHHVLHGLSYLRVLPVQVRLLTVEQMQVVLLGGVLVQLPRRSPEKRAPVVRLGTVTGVTPDVPVPLRVVAG
ncbi:MAG: hypothetical protein QOG75_6842 [Mycobacterium sp.]|jgi:hypothetical protein|nr:hypothetical protein [Mycobacterium sp.]